MRRFVLATFFLFTGIVAGNAQSRTVLTGPTTYYVAPAICNLTIGYWPDTGTALTACGSDTSGTGTQAAPFATPQHVRDLMMKSLDLACNKVTIQLAAYHGGQAVYNKGYNASGRAPGECGSAPPLFLTNSINYVIGDLAPITLQGDINNVTGAFFSPSGGNGGCVTLTEGAALQIWGITCDTTYSGQDGIDVYWNSLLVAGWIWFGNAGCGANCGQLHWGIAFNSTVVMQGPEWVTGSAWAHMNLGQFSTWYYNNNGSAKQFTVTILNNPSFPNGFWLVDSSQVWAVPAGVAFSGAAQGPKFKIMHYGLIETGVGSATLSSPTCNQALMPGNAPGQFINGGGICD